MEEDDDPRSAPVEIKAIIVIVSLIAVITGILCIDGMSNPCPFTLFDRDCRDHVLLGFPRHSPMPQAHQAPRM